jgi:hypothetical protein
MNAFSKKKRADAILVSFFGHSTISSYTVLGGCGSLWVASGERSHGTRYNYL